MIDLDTLMSPDKTMTDLGLRESPEDFSAWNLIDEDDENTLDGLEALGYDLYEEEASMPTDHMSYDMDIYDEHSIVASSAPPPPNAQGFVQ